MTSLAIGNISNYTYHLFAARKCIRSQNCHVRMLTKKHIQVDRNMHYVIIIITDNAFLT